MGRRLQIVGLAAALLQGPVAYGQTPALPEVLARLKAYLSTYGEQYSATVATERYRQTSGRASTPYFREARLESEFGIRFDDVDLSAFPETITWEFPTEAIASVAAILNEQSLTIDEMRVQLKNLRRDRGLMAKVKALFSRS